MEKYAKLFSKLEYLQNRAFSKLESNLVIEQQTMELSLTDYYRDHAKRFTRYANAQPILVSNDLLTSYVDPFVNVNFPSETYIKDPDGIVIFTSYLIGNSVYDICISTAHNTVFITQFILIVRIRMLDISYVANLARDRYFK